MAYRNFSPTFWAERIQRDNEKFKVFAQLCNRSYEGNIEKMGDKVNILGIGKPTIVNYTGADLPAPETLEDLTAQLVIDKAKVFNIMVDDIDRRQAVPGLMEDILAEASEALAVVEDTDIGAAMAAGAGVKTTVASLTKDTVRPAIYQARTALYKKGVGKGSEIFCVMSPDFFERLAQSVELIDTDNSETVRNGYVGRTAGVKLYLSNNVPTATGKDVILVGTKRATAFANQINKVEPYRMEKRFSDAVKGLNLYGVKVVRPDELVALTITAYA